MMEALKQNFFLRKTFYKFLIWCGLFLFAVIQSFSGSLSANATTQSITQTSAADFNVGTFSNTTVVGSGVGASVALTVATPAGGSVGTYAVGRGPNGIAFDPVTNSIWETDNMDATASKVNIMTGATATYAVGSGPYGVVFDPVTNSIWVTNQDSHSIFQMNPVTGVVENAYDVGSFPSSIVFDPITNSVWATNQFSGSISKVNVVTGAQSVYPLTGSSNDAGVGPLDIVFDPVTNSVWVANSGNDTSTIVQMDVMTGAIKNTYEVATGRTYGIAFDPVTNSIWVGHRADNTVSKVNVLTGSSSIYAVEDNPARIAFDPITSSIWVGNFIDAFVPGTYNNNTTIAKLNPKTGSSTIYDVEQHDPFSLIFDPVTNSMWTGNYGSANVSKMNVADQFISQGTFTSSAINNDTGYSTETLSLSWAESGEQTITMQARSGSDSAMTGASGWGSCAITNGGLLSDDSCVHNGDTYVQYRATLSTANVLETPYLNSVTIAYQPSSPVNNPPQFDTAIGSGTGIAVSVATGSVATMGRATFQFSALDPNADINGPVNGHAASIVTPSYQYSLDNGATWHTMDMFITPDATADIAMATGTYSPTSTITWNALADTGPQYTASARIRVKLDDHQSASNIVTATSSAFALNTYGYATTGEVITIPDGGQWGSSVSGSVVGPDNQLVTSWIFNGYSINNGTVTGNATFNDTSYNNGTVTGAATFNNTYNAGTVAGDATFNGASYNSGTVTGDATFNDTSYNSNVVTGNATFNGTGNNGGTVTKNATFNNTSYNDNTVTKNATFNNTSYNRNTVMENAIFNNESYNSNTVAGDATFNNTSHNDNTVAKNAIFNHTSYNNSTVAGDATFNNNTYNVNTITGNATFNDTGYNNNAVTGNATFNSESVNNGAVSGNGTFNDISFNNGTIAGITTISPPTPISLSPTSITAGESNFTLTVNGSHFIASSTIYFNGSARTTVFVSSTRLTALITAADIASVGSASITVATPFKSRITYAGAGSDPLSIVFDGTNMWTANNGDNSVTKVAPDGTMATYVGTGNGPFGIAFDGTNMWTANNGDNSVTKVAPDGTMTTYTGTGSNVRGIAFDGINMWTANKGDNSVTKVASDGTMTTYTGTGDGPSGIAFDGTNMWTANKRDNSVTRVSPTGTMITYAGTEINPIGIAFDGTNMWTANNGDNSVTKVSPDGTMTTYTGTGNGPSDIAFDDTNMWTANDGDNSVTKVAPDGTMKTYAGTGINPFSIAFDGTNMWTANEDSSATKVAPSVKTSNSLNFTIMAADDSAPEENKISLDPIKIKIGDIVSKFKGTIYSDKNKVKLKGGGSSLDNGTVKIYKNNKLWKTIVADAKGFWSIILKLKDNFSGWLKVRMYDQYGTFLDSQKAKIRVDTENPVFTNFIAPFHIARRGDILTWEVTDNQEIEKYKVTFNGHIKNTKHAKFTIPQSTSAGIYRIKVKVSDKAGNSATKSVFIVVR